MALDHWDGASDNVTAVTYRQRRPKECQSTMWTRETTHYQTKVASRFLSIGRGPRWVNFHISNGPPVIDPLHARRRINKEVKPDTAHGCAPIVVGFSCRDRVRREAAAAWRARAVVLSRGLVRARLEGGEGPLRPDRRRSRLGDPAAAADHGCLDHPGRTLDAGAGRRPRLSAVCLQRSRALDVLHARADEVEPVADQHRAPVEGVFSAPAAAAGCRTGRGDRSDA